jgi:3-deoxy-manno-octulosonate cytidylyltransferase (CMP-KDO synthetase)
MIIGIIPARFASTRLPGKILADIGGKPLIQHTYENSKKSKLLDGIVIAVDDDKVAKIARGFGAKVIDTPKDLQSGSDRVAYAARELTDAKIIVNIQADEPFIKGTMIDQAVEPLLFDKTVNISTLAKKIENVEELRSPSVVKVVFDYNNFALYFSRSPIPFVRDAKTNSEKIKRAEIYKHIGLYVYRKDYLFKFTKLQQTDLEKAEKLEQLRILESSLKIKIVPTELDSLSVDTQDDLVNARKHYLRYLASK